MDAFYYGWSQYWLMLLDAGHAPFETVPHAQSAVNNFLGLHLHDTQFYLDMGGWTSPDTHAHYAHGNILMWHHALTSKMIGRGDNSSVGGGSSYWAFQIGRGILPDNMGATWVASSTCDQLRDSVEGAWHIYSKGANKTFLTLAYDLFKTVLSDKGNISAHKVAWMGSGRSINALIALEKMAKAMGNDDDAAAWAAVLARNAPFFSNQWGRKSPSVWGANLGSIGAFTSAVAPEPYFNDSWAEAGAEKWLLNSEYGFYPPNATFGAVPLSFPINATNGNNPWLTCSPETSVAIDGLFRHQVGKAAVNLTLGHIGAMQRDFGWTVFPESWDHDGGLWGDQW